jgi:uncharacterized membrane protein
LNAQGAIGVFVCLIAVYAWVMDRLDAGLLAALAQAAARPDAGAGDASR